MRIIILVLSTFIMFINNTINYKINIIEETNKKFTKLENGNYLEISISDIIDSRNADYKNCAIEFWFVPMTEKKKLNIGQNAWKLYFKPMMQKLDEYIFKNKINTRIAGELKVGLINVFAKVIKNKFSVGGNDSASDLTFWDGYQQAASYIINNKEYLDTFFRNKKDSAVFETEYWTTNYFLDKEQLEALGLNSPEEVSKLDIEKFSMISWFPVLKKEDWDMEQDLFYDQETSISLSTTDDKPTVEFKFGDKTLYNLDKALIKYSEIDKIVYYSGWLAILFCTILKQKILEEFKIDATFAMQLATYIYKYREDVGTWKSGQTIYLEENFYWFEKSMELAYKESGSNFDDFKIINSWPI